MAYTRARASNGSWAAAASSSACSAMSCWATAMLSSLMVAAGPHFQGGVFRVAEPQEGLLDVLGSILDTGRPGLDGWHRSRRTLVCVDDPVLDSFLFEDVAVVLAEQPGLRGCARAVAGPA